MTDEEVEKIIKSNMNLQMNLAGIRQDFEEKLQRTWVGLTNEEHTELAIEWGCLSADWVFYAAAVERKVREKNT